MVKIKALIWNCFVKKSTEGINTINLKETNHEWSVTKKLSTTCSQNTETWQLERDNLDNLEFKVEVRTGKKFDVLSLNNDIEETISYAKSLNSLGKKLFSSDENLEKKLNCPACDYQATSTNPYLTVNHAEYKRCDKCGHIYVWKRPSAKVMKEIFTDEEIISANYAKEDGVQFRMDEIVKPKLDWILKIWYSLFESAPTSILDVGAGTGHFVKACRDLNIKTEGIEISKSSCQFAQDIFGIELKTNNFLHSNLEMFDILTMWGLLEYVHEPFEYLKKARQCVGENGMVVFEVPRDPSVSAMAQKSHTTGIARHLDPASHLNCFSESSIVHLLHRTGLKPVAIWRFGMDAYEMLLQIAIASNCTEFLNNAKEWIEPWQHTFDQAGLCDDIIVCSIPI